MKGYFVTKFRIHQDLSFGGIALKIELVVFGYELINQLLNYLSDYIIRYVILCH